VPTERSIPRFHPLQHALGACPQAGRAGPFQFGPFILFQRLVSAWRLSQYPLGDIGQLGFVEYAEVDIESAQPATEWQGWGPQILWVQSLELIPGQLPYAPVRVLRLKDLALQIVGYEELNPVPEAEDRAMTGLQRVASFFLQLPVPSIVKSATTGMHPSSAIVAGAHSLHWPLAAAAVES
jgi:hypothetical protein